MCQIVAADVCSAVEVALTPALLAAARRPASSSLVQAETLLGMNALTPFTRSVRLELV